MSEATLRDLPIVDARELDDEVREVLRPGERLTARDGQTRRLPTHFFEIPSWETAQAIQVTPSFALYEFIDVDVREAEIVRAYPRYVPLTVTLLAAHLEVVRREVGTYVHIGANGGYRTPAHRLSDHATPHNWGTAANIYRIGDDWLDDESTIRRYAELIRELFPTVWVHPFGHGAGETDDHLHLDLGYPVLVPRDVAEPRDEEDE